MANFDLIYTGKERGVKLPTGERIDRASESLSDFITKAETLKYQTFRENEKEFLKTSNIDPAFFISKASQDNQLKLLDEFNKRWSSEYKKYQGNLPMDAKQQMIAEKNFIISQQQEAQANEQRWREHDALVKQNPLRYDRNKHAVNTENFFGTGQYQNVMPPLKSKDFSMYLKEQSNKFNKGKIAYGSAKDEYGRIVDQYANISEKDIPSFIESNLFADDQALQGLTEEFLADQSPEKYALLTDTNKDDKITNADADENIIITWAKRNPKYIDAVRQIETVAKNPSKSGKTTFDWNLPIDVAHNKNNEYPVQPGVRQTTAYGTFDLPDVISFGEASQTTEQQQIPEIVEVKDGKEVITTINDAARFNIISYSPSKDIMMIKILDDGESVAQGEVVAVPAWRYDSLLKKKPFGYVRSGKQPTETKKLKWNPVTKQLE